MATPFRLRTACSPVCLVMIVAATTSIAPVFLAAQSPGLDHARLAAIRRVAEIAVSPDGKSIAYVLSVPRRPGRDDDGSAWAELHLVPSAGGASRPYVTGEVKLSSVRFTPDGRFLTYLARRHGDETRSLWAIPVAGGESRRWLDHDEKIESYRIAPDGKRVAFIALEAESDARERARDKGYKQEIFEEDWRPRRVYLSPLQPDPPRVRDPAAPVDDDDESEPSPLDTDGSAFGLEWTPDGKSLLLSLAPSPLIDDRYMARRVQIVDAEDGTIRTRLNNSGKLGKYAISPDGARVALITTADPTDPKEGRLAVADVRTGDVDLRDLWPDLSGHVIDFGWKDALTLLAIADVGVESLLVEIDVTSGRRTELLASNAGTGSPLLSRIRLSDDGRTRGLIGESPGHPAEAFVLLHGDGAARRLTESNPWLAGVALARQEAVHFKARDGLELGGILLHPLKPVPGPPPPLLLMVHGGPEGHDKNGWVTSYSRPAQVAAARGYAVLFPNYRGSTGRGVLFSKLGQGDAAGKEFDDLIDAADEMVERGLADRERIGINGGSYGGYATAWCATRYSDRFRAGVMFVGISNKLSKGLTTEIPVEDRMVHTRYEPWTRWEFGLERSPLFYAERSRTALLIAGGTADTRVHPSQSLQLYRALRLIGKTPVRYVRYPGEGHGNSRAAARDDYSRRLLRWMDHFVMQRNSELPPWELEIPALADDEDDDDDDDGPN